MTLEKTARDLFEACDTGGGSGVCRGFCHHDASFACQSDTLAVITMLAGYAEWLKGFMGRIPDGRFELMAIAQDADRRIVVATAVFHGTQTGAGGSGEPARERVASDYAYLMGFDGDRIAHMTTIWNDAQPLRQLGWA